MDANSYVQTKPNRNIPAFRAGDTIRVHATVVEGERRRIQVFEGVVIRIKKGGVNSNFTVRRVAHSVGVERVFPYFSPLIDKVEVTRVSKVRQSRLYFLRDRVGKAARLKPGSRARFESLTNRPYVEEPEEVEEIIEEVEEMIEAQDTAESAADEAAETEAPTEQTPEEAAQVEETIASESDTASADAAAAPASEPEAPAEPVVEEPETPEAEAVEELIESESGEEPGEATGNR